MAWDREEYDKIPVIDDLIRSAYRNLYNARIGYRTGAQPDLDTLEFRLFEIRLAEGQLAVVERLQVERQHQEDQIDRIKEQHS